MNIKYSSCLFLSTVTFGFFSQASLAAVSVCPSSSSNIGSVASCIVDGSASDIQLNFKSGFDSSAPTTPVGGNNGTTLGEQRRLAFIKAAESIADQIVSPQVIEVDANFSGLECNANSAVLGSAGATANFAYEEGFDVIPSGVLADTFYPVGLANSLSNEDILPSAADIFASFNSNLGQSNCLSGNAWYYGYSLVGGNNINFVSVLLHEMTHGLGFASLVDPTNGQKLAVSDNAGNFAGYLDDIFSTFLYSLDNKRTWSDPFMSDFQRRLSATSGDGLAWAGGSVNANAIGVLTQGFADNDNNNSFSGGDCALMYAPDPVEGGSSVSHFSTDAYPNELMEPSDTGDTDSLGLAFYLLQDIGWKTLPPRTAFVKDDGCGAYPDNATLSQRDSSPLQLSILGGSGNYDFELKQGSTDVTSLLNVSGESLEFLYPASGEFAGEYTLIITDNGSSDVIELTIIRPLRLVWSATDFMANHDTQTLTIEGGAAGTDYTIEQTPTQVLNFSVNGNAQNTTQAAADSANFNPASFEINSANQTAPSVVTLTVKSGGTYADATLNNSIVYPSRPYTLTVEDSRGNPLPNAIVSLDMYPLYERLNLEEEYQTNNNGMVTINLPVDGNPATVSVDLNGYTSRETGLSTIDTEQTVILFQSNVTEQTTPKFGSGGGGSFPIWMLALSSLLLLRRSRLLSH